MEYFITLIAFLCMLTGATVNAQGEGRQVFEKFLDQSAWDRDEFYYGEFPDNFGWGSSSSAYQIEGGWNQDGKGESIWDRFTKARPCWMSHNETGDVAADSYNKFDQDLAMIKELGLTHYRFTLSWPRIFPTGRGTPNQAGVDYYNMVIDKLLEAGVIPLVSLFHWDFPAALQDEYAGFNSSNVIDDFVAYADFSFRTFGDRVRHWITFNEPWVYCATGHGIGIAAPGMVDPMTGVYRCGHYQLLSHGYAYKRYYEIYPERNQHSGEDGVSITFNGEWVEPLDPEDHEHWDAAMRSLEFKLGWLAHPIFVNGDYPENMKIQIYNKTQEQDEFRHLGSRLPEFTEEEKELMNHSADFFCLQMYIMRFAEPQYGDAAPGGLTSFQTDNDAEENYYDTRWPKQSRSTWLTGTPYGIRRMLNYIKEEYGDVPIWITENGNEQAAIYDDFEKVFSLKSYLNEVLKAIDLDGVDVRGYCVWSLMDNFSWRTGLSGDKFGLYYVDFASEEKTRSPKRSALWYRDMIESKSFEMLPSDERHDGHFPEDFVWGATTSAYQVEGGHDADGKGISVWDTFTNEINGTGIADGSNGNDAAGSYFNIEEDIKQLVHLKVSHYSFSLSWSRILPTGTTDNVNEDGINYYNNLIDALISNNISPVVTLYHWDLPMALQGAYNGWLGDQIVDDFTDYARLAFSRFGDRVKMWMTMSGPQTEAEKGYDTGEHAPGITCNGVRAYIAAHHMILAHAKTWHVYDSEFRTEQGGKISIRMDADYGEAFDKGDQRDVEAADRFMQWSVGWFMHPLVNGDYPEVMKQRLAMLSSNEGRNSSRLPEFTDSQKEMIKGTIDYIAVNHFNTWYIADSNITLPPFVGDLCPGETAPVPETALPQVATDSGVFKMHDWSWQDTGNDDIKVTPWGIRRLLDWIQNDYGDYPIVVSGNGYSEPMFYTKYAVHNWFMPNAVINPGERPRDVGLEDTERVHYMNLYINEVLKAIEVDHVNVMGYFASSLMDGFEWSSGYTERYGLFRTNFTDFTRQPKESAQYYAQIISSHAAYHGNFDLHCDQYRQSTDMCHIRKAWFCDYASWRVKFFSTWLNMFLQYRDNSCDSHHFEVPGCQVTEAMIQCANDGMKICISTPIQDCPVCYCSDHEYQNGSQLNNIWQQDYHYWSQVADKWHELNNNH